MNLHFSESMLLEKSTFYALRSFVNTYFSEKDQDFFEKTGKYHFEKVHDSISVNGFGFNLMRVESEHLHKKVVSFEYYFNEKLTKISKEIIESEKDKEKVKTLVNLLEKPITENFSYKNIISNFEEFKKGLNFL